MPKPTLGSTVGGKYKLLRALGEGGMGTVYEVEHLLTHKRAAIKWVHPQTGSSDSAHDRLLHEARATSRIHHRNVVDVYDVLRADDAVCLVMQLLVGEPLSEQIARGPMPFTDFVALLLPAMRGVAAAHAAGVIHRDIKPDNIFLTKEPGQSEIVPKVIDFGISKVFDPKTPNQLTRSGITMGTPKYVSYEQLLGARDVDGRADVYAFGVMLYEAITGEPPYRAGTFGEQAVAFAMSVPPRPSVLRPNIPAALDVVVYRAVAKEREQRIGSIEALITELQPFVHAAAYPEPLLAFSENPKRRVSGAPEPHDTTAPAMATPASQRREELPEVSRLSPTPRAPLPIPSVRVVRRSKLGLGSLAVFACAVGLLGLLVWWLKVPSRHSASLPAALAEADQQETASHQAEASALAVGEPASAEPRETEREPIQGTARPSQVESSLIPVVNNSAVFVPAGAANEPKTKRVPPLEASKFARQAELQRVAASSATLDARGPAPKEVVEPREQTVEAAKPSSSSSESHRAGRLARDEF